MEGLISVKDSKESRKFFSELAYALSRLGWFTSLSGGEMKIDSLREQAPCRFDFFANVKNKE